MVLVLDGIGGLDLCGAGLVSLAAEERLAHEVRVVPWGHGLWHWFVDLTDIPYHHVLARTVAEEIEEFRGRRAGALVYLVGKSAGTGILVRALERLPANSVEAAVLLASALSPGYDLSRALRAVRREMATFRSPLDAVMLGLGTRIFGTVDRVHTAAAGLVGFRTPEEISTESSTQYAKLRQICWCPRMCTTGHFGGHFGADNPAFLREYVLPILHSGNSLAGGR